MQGMNSVKITADLLLHELQMAIVLLGRMAAAVLIELEDVDGYAAAVIPGFVALLLEFLVGVQLR